MPATSVDTSEDAKPLAAPPDESTDDTLIDQGNHALVSSAKNVGEATAILPVVSTLSFGFAAAELLAQTAAHASVLVLLALSASLSLYTTTYSVLEYYYLAMLTASDTKVQVSMQTESVEIAKRDGLAKKTDHAMRLFEPWRRLARDSLWGSVILILAAGAAQTIEQRGIHEWSTIVVIVILFTGAVVIPVTVYKFRRTFAPLLQEYREFDRAAGNGKVRVHPEDPLGE